jgi:hypothetical protein
MKKAVLLLFLLTSLNLIAQNSIIFDVNNSSFELHNGVEKNNKMLIKNTDYQIALKNYNPFYYENKVTITSKDDLKDFFQFLTKLGNVTVDDITTITQDQITIRSISKSDLKTIELYLERYNEAYLINQDLEQSSFDYKDLSLRLCAVDHKKLLKDYMAIKNKLIENLKPNEEIEKVLKLLGLPTQIDVEKIYKQMMQLDKVLVIYIANDGLYPIDNFSTDLFSKITIEIQLTPKSEIEKDRIIKKSKAFNVKSNIVVNFSSGIYMAWNSQNEYYTKQNENGMYSIGVESERKFFPGVSVLGHLLYAYNPNIGVVVGAGIDIEATPNILLGMSYKPKNSNILISAGVGYSYQEKLSDQFKTNFEYVDNPTLSYKKVMESGYWFGISYKIF